MKIPISLVTVILLFAVCTHSQFMPQRLRIVDQNKQSNNFLVRGNLPISTSKLFQINQLKTNLSELTGLQKYKLIVYNLMNFFTAKQTRNTYIEQSFFQQNPNQAIYRHKVILGSLIDPSNMPSWVVQTFLTLGSILDLDSMDQFVSQLHTQIYGKQSSVIIYIHCSAGIDRTGYVAASYKLKFLNYSLQDALKENIEVMGGLRNHMHFNTENGLKWFCHSLARTKEQCLIPK